MFHLSDLLRTGSIVLTQIKKFFPEQDQTLLYLQLSEENKNLFYELTCIQAAFFSIKMRGVATEGFRGKHGNPLSKD